MDDQWHPASLTKIMTAYMAFKAIKAGKIRLDDKVICTQLANQQPPSKIGLPIGGELTVELALQALIVKSANDVAVMLAEKISGSELQFVADMNATARELGMTRTQFSNANGLPAFGQVTTARDLAKLARAVSAEFPEYSPYWAMTQMRIGKIRLSSHNGLLKTFEGADGLKTGFICDSGFNVVASATRDGRRLMAVVLGEPSGGERNIRAASLLEHGFQQLGWKQIFNQATDRQSARAARRPRPDQRPLHDPVVGLRQRQAQPRRRSPPRAHQGRQGQARKGQEVSRREERAGGRQARRRGRQSSIWDTGGKKAVRGWHTGSVGTGQEITCLARICVRSALTKLH